MCDVISVRHIYGRYQHAHVYNILISKQKGRTNHAVTQRCVYEWEPVKLRTSEA